MSEVQRAERSRDASQITPQDAPALLQRLIDLFAAGDAAAIAELWDAPALIMGDEQVHGTMSRGQIEKLFWDASAKGDIGNTTPTDLDLRRQEWISRRVVLVELGWPKQRARGFLHGVTATTFVLRIDEQDNLKIRALLLHSNADPERATGRFSGEFGAE